MKVTQAALAILLCSAKASAWTTARYSPRALVATQLHSTATAISTEVDGEEATESFRLKFSEDSKPISPWHDIALKNGKE